MDEAKRETPKYYPILDLLKIIAALLVIAIHIFPEGSTPASVGLDQSIRILLGESFVYAILRPAVPIFFSISSFLLFRKIQLEPAKRWQAVGTFCLRLLFLYLFWYVVGLPLTIKDIAGFASQGDTDQLIRYAVITLWKGAPRGYWFLVALALGVLIVSLCRSKCSFIAISIIAGILYAYGCLNAAYFGLFALKEDPSSKAFFAVGNYMELSFCILQGLLFVVFGRLFAIHGPFQIKGNLVWTILFFFLMMGELFFTLYQGICLYPDAYFTLPIFLFFFMNQMLQINIKNERFAARVKQLRKAASFSYLFHIQFFVYLHWVLDSLNCNIFREQYALLIIPYLICVFLSIGLQWLFERLSKYRYLRFLKYSY